MRSSARARSCRARRRATALRALCAALVVARARGETDDAVVDDALERARTPLVYAVSDRNATRVREVLAATPAACERERTPHGETALHVAAIEVDLEIVDALLASGSCDADARTNGGRYLSQTAMMWFAHGPTEAHARAMEALIEGGADANLENDDGRTALDIVEEGRAGDEAWEMKMSALNKCGAKRGRGKAAREAEKVEL